MIRQQGQSQLKLHICHRQAILLNVKLSEQWLQIKTSQNTWSCNVYHSRFSSLTLSSCKEQISGKFSRSTSSNNESVREIQIRTAKFPAGAGYYSQLS